MKLKSGIAYQPQKMQGLEVIDDNIVRPKGMCRLQSKNKTAFQQLLIEIHHKDYLISVEQFKSLSIQLLQIPSLSQRGKITLFSHDDALIIDAYNDSAKRHFDSLFAKKILIYIANSKKYASSLSLLIQELTHFYTEEYKTHSPDFLKKWNEAKSGQKVKDESLDFFSDLRPDLVNLVKEKHFNTNDNLIIKLYDFHYLTHSISSLASYQNRHPNGIFEIYNKKSNTYYSSKNRGRIHGYGFSVNTPSYSLGIFRSIDKTPYDMRKSSLTSNTTRCPDRLYIEHPGEARKNPLSWLNYGFSNPLNSCFVLGLSGSTLLEARALLFFIHSINQGHYHCKFLSSNFYQDIDLIRHYLLFIISLFVYFEGGHTLSEILTVFEIEEVSSMFDKTLAKDNESNVISRKTLIHNQEPILDLMKEALIDTAKYYSTLQTMEIIHDKIKNPPSPLKQ